MAYHFSDSQPPSVYKLIKRIISKGGKAGHLLKNCIEPSLTSLIQTGLLQVEGGVDHAFFIVSQRLTPYRVEQISKKENPNHVGHPSRIECTQFYIKNLKTKSADQFKRYNLLSRILCKQHPVDDYLIVNNAFI